MGKIVFQSETDSFHQQGIMFMPDNQRGWSGGYPGPPPFGFGKSYETTNGGINWSAQTWGYNVNRFRYINDSVMYAVGKTVYKYSRFPIGIQQISSDIPGTFTLHQNYPNPFNPNTNIKFEIPISAFINITIFDALGKEITVLANKNVNAGIYNVNWDASGYPSGVYFYRIITENFTQSRKMILIK
jgi:hypothetical protein